MLRGLMRLEERIVLDGVQGSDHDGDSDGPDAAPDRILVVDSSVNGADVLSAAARDNVVVVNYDSRYDSLDSLFNKIVSAGEGLDIHSIAFANHGIAADMQLAVDGRLSLETLSDNPDIVAFWQGVASMLVDDGRIDLLSCDFYRGDEGRDLLAALEALTGVDFAASENQTGNPAYGGDWLLESDDVEVDGDYFDRDTLADFAFLLFPPQPGTVFDSYPTEIELEQGKELVVNYDWDLAYAFGGMVYDFQLVFRLNSPVAGELIQDLIDFDTFSTSVFPSGTLIIADDGIVSVWLPYATENEVLSALAGLKALTTIDDGIERSLEISSSMSAFPSSPGQNFVIAINAGVLDSGSMDPDGGDVDPVDNGPGFDPVDDGPGIESIDGGDITIDLPAYSFGGDDIDRDEWQSFDFDLAPLEELVFDFSDMVDDLGDSADGALAGRMSVDMAEIQTAMASLGRSIRLLLAEYSRTDPDLGEVLRESVTELAATGQNSLDFAGRMISAANETFREWASTPAERRDGELADRMTSLSENLSEVNARVSAVVDGIVEAANMLASANAADFVSADEFSARMASRIGDAYEQLKAEMERRDSVFFDLELLKLKRGEAAVEEPEV